MRCHMSTDSVSNEREKENMLVGVADDEEIVLKKQRTKVCYVFFNNGFHS